MIEAGWSHGPFWEIQYLKAREQETLSTCTTSLLLEPLAEKVVRVKNLY